MSHPPDRNETKWDSLRQFGADETAGDRKGQVDALSYVAVALTPSEGAAGGTPSPKRIMHDLLCRIAQRGASARHRCQRSGGDLDSPPDWPGGRDGLLPGVIVAQAVSLYSDGARIPAFAGMTEVGNQAPVGSLTLWGACATVTGSLTERESRT